MWLDIRASHLAYLLHAAASAHPAFGVDPRDITARSLRTSGAMGLLNREVDPMIIRLLGRWRSDAMCRYLHLQAHDRMRHYAPLMLEGGDYTLLPATPAATL